MLKITTLPETASVAEIQRNYRKLLNKAKSTRSPLYILRNNFPEAVIVDVQSWNEIVRRLQREEERDALEAIREYEIEKKAGALKVLSAGKLSKLLKK